jgi:hypothetical protein
MSTIWNLTEFTELEEPVLTEYMPQRKRRSQRQSVLTRSIAVVALATGLSIMPISAQSTRSEFAIPYMEAAAYSGLELEPPLGNVFADRFNAEWSESAENALLAEVHKAKRAFTKAELEDQTVHSIYFNQHDEPSGSGDKLTVDQIRKIVRQKKLV